MSVETADYRVMKVKRPCPIMAAGCGCGCIGLCQEEIEVVPVEDAARIVGERDEARRLLREVLAHG